MKKNSSMTKIIFFSLFILTVLTICLFSYKIALAEVDATKITIEQPKALGGSVFGQDIPHVISLIFNIVISASGAVFIILFLIGGIQYLSSAGNEEATGKAKKVLLDAVIGLVLVLSSWAIGTWVINSLSKGTGSSSGGGGGGSLTIPSKTSVPFESISVSPTSSPSPSPTPTETNPFIENQRLGPQP